MSTAPFLGVQATSIRVGESPVVRPDEEVQGTWVVVRPGLFETLGIRLSSGRLFGDEDRGAGSVTIVSEALARRFWPQASAIGKRIRLDNEWRSVVGVVNDLRHQTLDEVPRATFYVPAAQTDRWLETLVVRADGDPRSLLPQLRALAKSIDPDLAVVRLDRLSDRIAQTLVAERFRAALFVVFAVVATLIAAAGIYGVASGAVARRSREMAIRMAVGATPGTVLRLVMRSIVVVASLGALIGVGLAAIGSRTLAPFLFGVAPFDGVSFAFVAVLTVLVAAGATLVPARRAARTQLTRTLAQ
jgi:hypothetical protein